MFVLAYQFCRARPENARHEPYPAAPARLPDTPRSKCPVGKWRNTAREPLICAWQVPSR